MADVLPRPAWALGQVAQLAVIRLVPIALWRTHRRLEGCWLPCERRRMAGGYRFCFGNLPPTASVTRLARLAHQALGDRVLCENPAEGGISGTGCIDAVGEGVRLRDFSPV